MLKKTPYPYQEIPIKIMGEQTRGSIVLPTGTGKTLTAANGIVNDILSKNKKFGIYVINAPRIILTYQLFLELFEHLTYSDVKARFMLVHSGSNTDEKELENIRLNAKLDNIEHNYSQVSSSTKTKDIFDMIEKAKIDDVPLIIVSTYNSALRIEDARVQSGSEIEMIVNDEAHFLTRPDFAPILTEVATKKMFFFTATMQVTLSDEGRGMNNTSLFGKVLHVLKPYEAIQLGKMARPRIHIVSTVNEDIRSEEDLDRSKPLIIKKSFEQHSKQLGDVKPKMLVATRGTAEMKKFLASEEYQELLKDNVTIFVTSSTEEIGNDINGKKVTRQEFLKTLKKLGVDPQKKIIVLHYDILSEGIDVPGLTGVILFRTMRKSKFLQTFGRVTRIHPIDRERIDSGEIQPSDLDKMVKPFAYLIIPSITIQNKDDVKNVLDYIDELRDYNFDAKEDIVFDSNGQGLPKDLELETDNELDRNESFRGAIIEHLKAIIENIEDTKLTKKEFVVLTVARQEEIVKNKKVKSKEKTKKTILDDTLDEFKFADIVEDIGEEKSFRDKLLDMFD